MLPSDDYGSITGTGTLTSTSTYNVQRGSISANLAGSVGLTKSGSNTVTLSGANTYTGLTTVGDGVLQLGLNAQASVLTGGGADVQGGKLVLDYTGGSSPASTVLSLLTTSYGALPHFATGQIRDTTAAPLGLALGWKDDHARASGDDHGHRCPVTLISMARSGLSDHTKVSTNWGNGGKVWGQGDFDYDGNVGASDKAIVLANWGRSAPHGSHRTWDGGGADNNWTTIANWAGNVAPAAGDHLVFAGNTQRSSVNDFPTGTLFDDITFESGGGIGYSCLSGNGISLSPQNGVAINSEMGSGYIGMPITLDSASTFVVSSSGGLCFGSTATIDTNGYLLTVDISNNSALNDWLGNVIGSGGLTKIGDGTLILDGANTYTGLTTVVGGTLELELDAQEPVLTGGGADIQRGKLVFDYTTTNPASTIEGLLATSYGNDFASGQICNTTAAATDWSLGWVDDGTEHQVTVMATPSGDANLDGVVDTVDEDTVDANLGTGTMWQQGDFTYNGVVGLADLTEVQTNLGERAPLGSVTRIWDGGSTVDDNWTTPENWVGDVAPVAGDRLIFAGTTRMSPVNDFPDGTVFDSITINDGGFNLSGSRVTLNSQDGIAINNVEGENDIALSVTLTSSSTFVIGSSGGLSFDADTTVDANANLLTIDSLSDNTAANEWLGSVIGDGGLKKVGGGILTLDGTNTYAGLVTITAGTLELGVDAQDPVLGGRGANIRGGKLVLDYTGGSSPASTVLSLLSASYATSPHFASGQIHSSAANSTHGLGWADDGVSQVEIVYTIYGDADLDGAVGTADEDTVDANLGSGTTWQQGDFNYDGDVDSADQSVVLANDGLSVATGSVTRVWDGGGVSSSYYWSYAANWVGDVSAQSWRSIGLHRHHQIVVHQ